MSPSPEHRAQRSNSTGATIGSTVDLDRNRGIAETPSLPDYKSANAGPFIPSNEDGGWAVWRG